MGDPQITGEHEIDIGLRKRPLRGLFIKGPLRLRELAPVARLPGKTLAVWLLIRHRVDLIGATQPRFPNAFSKNGALEKMPRLTRCDAWSMPGSSKSTGRRVTCSR
jgi:hypothetical protein